jgi:hypothetical protein
MKFAFDTDEVLRDTLNKMSAVYEKFFIEDYVYEEGEEEFKYEIIEPINSYNFSDHFKFPSDNDYINFMYMDFPMNICGHAPSISANTFNTLSAIQKTTLKKKDKLTIIAKAIAKQKPATLFFLSKYGTEVDEVIFYNKKNLKKMWSKFDVIVTSNPELLECKPKNKISIKVSTEYNKNINADFNIDTIEDFTSLYNQLNLKHVKSIR